MVPSLKGHNYTWGRCLLVVTVLVVAVGLVEAVDRHKLKKCSDSSFCKRHRSIEADTKPFEYVLEESSIKVKDNTLTAKVRETKSQVGLDLEMSLFASNIIRVRIDEEIPLSHDNLRYRVTDVIQEENLKAEGYGEWNALNKTLAFAGGKIVIDPKAFRFDFFHHNNLALSLNQRGLFYMEQVGTPKPVQVEQRTLQEFGAENGADEAPVEFGPDGNPIIGTREHVGAVNRDVSHDEISVPYENSVPHEEEGHLQGIPVENVDGSNNMQAIHKHDIKAMDMEGAWEERFGGTSDPKKRGPESMGMDITFHGTQHVYGIPEHATDLNLPPTRGEGSSPDTEPYRLYNLDVFEYELNNGMALYGAVPILIAHDAKKTSGILWLNAAETWIDIEKPHQHGGVLGNIYDALNINKDEANTGNNVLSHLFSESGVLEVYIMLGATPKEVMEQYKLLTGPAQLPSISSIAHHQCRWNYKDQQDVLAVNQGFDTHGIPMDYIWLDIEHTDSKKYFTWDGTHFPNSREMLDTVASKGRKMVTIVDPHIKRDGGYEVHQKATALGHYVKNAHGSDYDGHCWPGSSSYLDFLNPEVRKWWAGLYSYDHYVGSTSSLFTWNDMNEPSVFNGPEITMPKDNLHFGNVEHRHIHNQYGFYMHLATAEGQIARDGIENPIERKRPFVLTRSFFAGSQKWGAVWTGDNTADWGHLKISFPMIMSLGMGGIPFSGADVGGFFKDPSPELLARWYQAGAWYPFFRAHAHIDTKRREPWIFADPYLSVMRNAVRTRYNFLPYWYTQFYETHKTLTPMMRPLFFEYPKDPITFGMDDQFMVGPSILVKPVVTEGASTIDVYLPGPEEDVWYDYITHQSFTAGHIITVETPLEYTPIFVRGGSIVSLKDRLRRSTTQMKNDPYSLFVALDENNTAVGKLYIDDGETFQYQDQQFELLQFEYNAESKSSHFLTVAKDPSSGTLTLPNTLNRVTILGVETAPSSITLVVDGGSPSEVGFEYDAVKQELTLRNPGQRINSDWYFTIDF